MKKYLSFKSFVAVFTLGMVFSSNAYAYLDPGTGSLILQAIIGTVAAVAATAGVYWHKFKSFFSKNDNSSSDDQDKNNEQTD